MKSTVRWAALLFFLSGVSGLVYETAWTRLFQDLFGHSVHTTAAVLAAFMGGLGLGALLAGRWVRRCARPLFTYGLIELGLALWVLATPLQVRLVDQLVAGLLAGSWATPWLGEMLRWLLAFAMLVLPTAAMGATLPILCHGLTVDERRIGSSFGLLYGVNTLGAVAGVVAAGFWLIRVVGVLWSLRVGCLLSLAAGLGALTLSRHTGEAPPHLLTGRRPGPAAPAVPKLLLGVVFASGFAALAYEVVWIRLFVYVLGSSILSFSLVLGVLLAAFAVGSVLFPLVVADRRRHLEGLVWLQCLLGLAALGTMLFFVHLDRVLALTGLGMDSLAGRVLLTVLVLALPGLAMGAALPAATGAIRDAEEVGRGVGRLYASNTLGNIAGSLAAGYLLVPKLGPEPSLLLLAALNLVLAAVVAGGCLERRRRRLVGLPALAVVVLAVVGWSLPEQALDSVYGRQNPHARLLAATVGLRGTVTVHEVPPLPLFAANDAATNDGGVAFGYRLVAVDGVDVAGTAPDLRTTQKAQAHIPLLLHGAPQEVLQVGFGSGETTVEVARHRPRLFHLAEINPDVISTSNKWFPQFAGAPFTPFFVDAKNYIRTTRQRYDAILNDSTYPGLAGSSQLYSADHLRACRAHLEPGGVVSTWLPVDLPVETFRLVVATFASVFPESSFWLPANCWNKHGVLVGTLGDAEARLAAVAGERWPPELAPSLEALGAGTPELFAALRVLDAEGVAALSAGAPVSSDDRPLLEYPSRGLEVSGEEFWAETLAAILEHPPSDGFVSPPHREAVRLIFEGQLALMSNRPERALELYGEAHRRWPEHPGPARLIRDIQRFRAQAAFAAALAAARNADEGRALELFGEAAHLAPASAAAHLELGRRLFAARRFQVAVPELEQALRLGEGLDQVRLMLGDARALSGDPVGAEAEYRLWLSTHEATPEAVAALAESLLDQGRIDEGLETLRQDLALAPEHPAIRRRIAEVEGRQGMMN